MGTPSKVLLEQTKKALSVETPEKQGRFAPFAPRFLFLELCL